MVLGAYIYYLPPIGADLEVTWTGGRERGQLTGRPSLQASTRIDVQCMLLDDSTISAANSSNLALLYATVDLSEFVSYRLDTLDSSAEILFVSDFLSSLVNPRCFNSIFQSLIFFLESLMYLMSSTGFLPLVGASLTSEISWDMIGGALTTFFFKGGYM